MRKSVLIMFAGILIILNILLWQEVFLLSGKRYLKVDFLNVGQGDSEFITTPGGNRILIDGGPDSSVLSKLNSRMPFFDRTIDLIILSHPEKDHMTGIMDVLEKYHVKYFIWSGVNKSDEENRKLSELLRNASLGQDGTKIITASAGDKIQMGNVMIDILFPLENVSGKEEDKSSNDTCIVDKLIYGDNSFLFTGDIDDKAEKKIVNSKEDISADVLKVAHHGSKYSTSETFLKSVSPKFAVIEVGKNSYGHPAPETLQRLNDFGIKTERTDINGDIEFISDGKIIKNN